MSGLASSPVRSPEKPMAFTNDEFLRGGITAWLVFMALLVCGEAVHLNLMMAPGSGFSVPEHAMALLLSVFGVALIAAFVSGVALPVGLALVLPVARAMSRVRSIAVHLALYVALGLAVAGAYVAACTRGQLSLSFPLSAWDYFLIIPAASALSAIPIAWWWTARRALRIDAGLIAPRRRRADPDAAYEDHVAATGQSDVSGES